VYTIIEGGVLKGLHLGPVTRLVLILVKYVCFCSKCCVCSGKCVSIILKIKYVNFGNMSNICNKLNFITNYTHFITTDTYFIKKQYILQFLTHAMGRSRSRT
jgi:hypothetical protein